MFQTGDQIGPYSLTQKLGKGTFGEVWLAEEKTAISSHKAALKLPNEEDVDVEAIRQEADVWESVKGHPNILPIIKADIYEGQIYIASEYAPGGSLSEWLKEHNGKAPTTELAVRMTLGILSGLEHLHSKGVIHRDLKPANILLQAETPRIADFGIARLIKSAATANSTMSAGTPSYMAPECFYGIRSEQTDIWAVGVLFHKLLTGKLPFSQPDQVSMMNAVLNSEPEIDSGIPDALRQIIDKALQKDPAQRYQSATEMRNDLHAASLALPTAEEEIAPSPAAAAVVAPATGNFEREEETVVRREQPVIYVEREKPSGWQKFLPVAVGLLLVLAAVTVWSAFQFGKSKPPAQTDFSNSSNQSNANSNLRLPNATGERESLSNDAKSEKKKSSTNSETNSDVESQPSPDESQSEESRKNEKPPATPYDIQPDETTNVSPKPRPRKTETPSTDDEDTPPPPLPSKSPTATPAEIGPTPKPKPSPKATEKPEETPPPPKNKNSNEN